LDTATLLKHHCQFNATQQLGLLVGITNKKEQHTCSCSCSSCYSLLLLV